MVVNKKTNVHHYLEEHKIVHVVHFANSLIDNEKVNQSIIDIDKFIYIYYGDTTDEDVAFKSDLNRFRKMLDSTFFSTRSILFILVKSRPNVKDFIESTLKDTTFPKEDVEIIEHTGELMLPDLTKYISGINLGDITKNTYINVYLTEKGKNEKVRFPNTASQIERITPQLADEMSMYLTRVKNLGIANDRIINQQDNLPTTVDEFPILEKKTLKFTDTIIITGIPYTNYDNAALYYSKYLLSVRKRCLLINMNEGDHILSQFNNNFSMISLHNLTSTYIPEHPISYISLTLNSLSFFIANEANIESIDIKIILVSISNFDVICRIFSCLPSILKKVVVLHKKKDDFEKLKLYKWNPTVILVQNALFNDNFDLLSYSSFFKNSSCVLLPNHLENILDIKEFYYNCFSKGSVDDE